MPGRPTCFAASRKFYAHVEGCTDHGNGSAWSTQGAKKGVGSPLLAFVKDHNAYRAGILCILRLQGEGACAALDDSDVPSSETVEV